MTDSLGDDELIQCLKGGIRLTDVDEVLGSFQDVFWAKRLVSVGRSHCWRLGGLLEEVFLVGGKFATKVGCVQDF